MGRGSTRSRAVLGLISFATLVVLATAGVDALSTGITRELASAQDVDLTQQGCSCHNPTPLPDINIKLDGIPGQYAVREGEYEQETYEIQLTWEGGPEAPEGEDANHGGFNLFVTDGRLLPPEGPAADWIQIGAGGQEATHTITGEKQTYRNFTLLWESPASPDGPVSFIVTVNSVNGNGAPAGDEWAQAIFVSNDATSDVPAEAALVGGGPAAEPIHHLGVHYLAYWVGVISFAVLFIVYGAVFFLFKYGETNHTTDHKDRSREAPKQLHPLLTAVAVIGLSFVAIVAILWLTGNVHLGG